MTLPQNRHGQLRHTSMVFRGPLNLAEEEQRTFTSYYGILFIKIVDRNTWNVTKKNKIDQNESSKNVSVVEFDSQFHSTINFPSLVRCGMKNSNINRTITECAHSKFLRWLRWAVPLLVMIAVVRVGPSPPWKTPKTQWMKIKIFLLELNRLIL